MVLEVTLLFTRSSSALVIFNVMVLPLMARVQRIGPVTPWGSVLLMSPWGRNCAMKLPPPLKVIDSFMLPTVPSQLPTIFALYSASATGFAGMQDQTPRANTRSRPSRTKMKLCFMGIFSYQVLLVAVSNPTPTPTPTPTLRHPNGVDAANPKARSQPLPLTTGSKVRREKKTGARLMVGASDGGTDRSQQRFGVSVLGFRRARSVAPTPNARSTARPTRR